MTRRQFHLIAIAPIATLTLFTLAPVCLVQSSLAGDANFELTPYFSMVTAPSIPFEIPQNLRYGSTKQTTKANGINILVDYSKTAGIFRSDGKSDRRCEDGCGRILLSIRNLTQPGEPQTAADRAAAGALRLLEGTSRYAKVKISEVASAGFTRAIEARTTTGQSTPDTVERFYFRKDNKQQHYDLFAACTLWTTVHVCRMHFSLPCEPTIEVETSSLPTFETIDQAEPIRSAAEQFMTSMVQTDACRAAAANAR